MNSPEAIREELARMSQTAQDAVDAMIYDGLFGHGTSLPVPPPAPPLPPPDSV